jgi:hypothetical protein
MNEFKNVDHKNDMDNFTYYLCFNFYGDIIF